MTVYLKRKETDITSKVLYSVIIYGLRTFLIFSNPFYFFLKMTISIFLRFKAVTNLIGNNLAHQYNL